MDTAPPENGGPPAAAFAGMPPMPLYSEAAAPPDKAMFQPWEQQAAGYPEPGRMPAHMAWGHHPAHHPAAHGHAHPARVIMPEPHNAGMGSRNRDTGELSKTNIYISGLKSTTTDEDLKQLCQSYGTIVSAKAIIDRELNHCKGYGFVMFEKESSAKAAVEALVRSGAQAAFAKVTRAQTEWQGRQEADPTNLYLTNLPKDMDEAALTHMLLKCLDSFGEVVSCRVLRDDHGMSRGVGLARMDSRQACETIIKRLNGCVLPHNNEPLRVKFANGPSPRKFKFLHRDNFGMATGRPMHPQSMGDPGNPGAAAVVPQAVYEPVPLDQAHARMAYQAVPTRYVALAPGVPPQATTFAMHDVREGGRGGEAPGSSKAAPAINGSRLATWVPELGSEASAMPTGDEFGRGFAPMDPAAMASAGMQPQYEPMYHGHAVMMPEYNKMMPVQGMFTDGAPPGAFDGFFLTQG